VDEANHSSVNFHPLSGTRYVLSRTCEGPPEYSGRGGRQLYTHALVIDQAKLQQSRYQPFAIYRDALALGYFCYRPEPDTVLAPVQLSTTYQEPDDETWAARAKELGVADLDSLRRKLDSGEDIKFPYAGNRALLAECLLGPLDHSVISEVSFTTSLHPSAVRPYRLVLVDQVR
jgi:hypothetical protein